MSDIASPTQKQQMCSPTQTDQRWIWSCFYFILTTYNKITQLGIKLKIHHCPPLFALHICFHYYYSNIHFCHIDFSLYANISFPDQINNSLEVRLINSTAPNAGRVELRKAGVWGTICGIDWSSLDATVVCRMLGYDIGYILYFLKW